MMPVKYCSDSFQPCSVCHLPSTRSICSGHFLSSQQSRFTLSSSHHSALFLDLNASTPSSLFLHSFRSDVYWTHWSFDDARFTSYRLAHKTGNCPVTNFSLALIFMSLSDASSFMLRLDYLGDNAVSGARKPDTFWVIMISHFFIRKTRSTLRALALSNVR